MIKRIVFDLDNTLTPWKDEYWLWIDYTLLELGISYDENIKNGIIKKILDYEKECSIFERKGLVNYLNNKLNLNLPISFMDVGLKYLKKMAPNQIEEEVEETLKYLKSKYDLVILSNWFKESQIGRLEKMGILKYFSHVYGVDNLQLKPHKNAFEQVFDGYNKEECLMIGDDLERDIVGAFNVGMNVLLYDKENIHDTKYPKFSSYVELQKKL